MASEKTTERLQAARRHPACRLLGALVPGRYGEDLRTEVEHGLAARLAGARGLGDRLRAHRWAWRQVLSFDVLRLRGLLGARRRALRTAARRGAGPLVESATRLAAELWRAGRGLVRRPRFALLTTSILALGLGAVTVLFSLVHRVVLAPLDVADADRLVVIQADRSVAGSSDRHPFGPAVLDMLRDTRSFSALEAHFGYRLNLSTDDGPRSVHGARVTDGFLDVFGRPPHLGRTFTPDDRHAVVLSWSLWQTQFAADPEIVGREVWLEDLNPLLAADASVAGQSFEVIGVLPADLALSPWLGAPHVAAQAWIPLHAEEAVPNPHSGVLEVIARLRPGVGHDAARAELARVAARLHETYPEVAVYDPGFVFAVDPLQDLVVRGSRGILLPLTAAGLFLLLVVVANCAHLFVTRGLARAGEMAVRDALGAGRGEPLRLALLEALWISGTALVAGCALAHWTLPLAARWLPPDTPRLGDLSLSWPALAATSALVVLFTLLLAGASAGLAAARRSLARARRAESWHAHAMLIQTALTVVLLFCAGLSVDSLQRLLDVERGFSSAHRLTFELYLPQARFPTAADKVAITDRLYGRLEQIPGVLAAGGSDQIPPVRFRGMNPFVSRATERPVESGLRTVTRSYPRAVGLELVAGRLFDDRDGPSSAPVVLVTEEAAARLWPAEEAVGNSTLGRSEVSAVLGRTLRIDGYEPWGERMVVGVVRDMATYLTSTDVIPEVYQMHEQDPWNQQRVLVQTVADPAAYADQVRAALSEVDPLLSIANVRTLEEHVDAVLVSSRFLPRFLGLFTAAALLLAAVGTFAVLSFGVAGRRREIAIRVAVGASSRDIETHFLHRAMGRVAAGAVLGVVVAPFAGRLLAGRLHGVEAAEPGILALAAAIVLAVALAAAWPATRRAARIDPAHALRGE